MSMYTFIRAMLTLCILLIISSCSPVKPMQASGKVGVKQLVIFMNKVDLLDEDDERPAADSTEQGDSLLIQSEPSSRSIFLQRSIEPPSDSLIREPDSAMIDTGIFIPLIEESQADPDSIRLVPEPSEPSTLLDILQINHTLEMISQALRPEEQALSPLQPGDRIRLFILDQDSVSGEIIRSIFTGEIRMQ